MLQRLTLMRHANESPRCEVRETLNGGCCENPGTQRTIDGLLCEQHAMQFGLEERIACWEAILLHIELWLKVARRRGREDIVGLLQLERAEAAAALARAHEDLEKAESEGYERKERDLRVYVLRDVLRGRATSNSPKSFDIPNVDEASPQLYGSFILKRGESPGYSLSVSPDHGAQTLVGVVLGYLDILTSHYSLSFAEKEDEVR